jgi:hypothetical protein
VLDGRHYTPKMPEGVASVLRAIGLPVRNSDTAARQPFAIVLVVEGGDTEDAEHVCEAVTDLVGANESILHVGPACPLGCGYRPSYSTRQLCLDTGDRRDTLTVTPGEEALPSTDPRSVCS